MPERNILSYFANSEQAQQAETELKQLGYEVAQVDRINRFPADRPDADMHNPLSGQVASLSNQVLGTRLSDDAGILAASDPSVSGQSASEIAGSYPFILTVVTGGKDVEAAVAVIKKHGGFV